MADGISLNGLPPLKPIDPFSSDGSIGPSPGSSQENSNPSNINFKDLLLSALDNVNNLQIQADQAVQNLAQTGDMDKIPEVLTSMKKAELSFDALLQIRNKLIDAYQELSRMPI